MVEIAATNLNQKTSSAGTIEPSKGHEIISLIESPTRKNFQSSNSHILLDDEEKRRNRKHNDLAEQFTLYEKMRKSKNVNRSFNKSDKCCILCATCTCEPLTILRSLEEQAEEEAKNPLSIHAKSDSQKERLLRGRLGRLEKSASFVVSLYNQTDKELKSFKAKILNEWKVNEAPNKFLPDVYEDELLHQESLRASSKLPMKVVKKAKRKSFSIYVKDECQPTLTQIFGDDDDDNNGGDDSVNNYSEDEQSDQDDIQPECEITIQDEDSTSILLKPDTTSNYQSLCTDEERNQIKSELNVEYEIASSRGKHRSGAGAGLWGLSSVTKNKFDETKHVSCDELMPLEENDFKDNERYDEYRHEILALLSTNENDGMKMLVEFFQDDKADGIEMEEKLLLLSQSTSNNDVIDKGIHEEDMLVNHHVTATLSQLSPRRKDTFQEMKSNIIKDIDKMEGIQTTFPNWEENIIYAFQQRPEDTKEALHNVRERRRRIKEAKDAMLKYVNQLDLGLDLFESVLSKSLSMHDEKDMDGKMDAN